MEDKFKSQTQLLEEIKLLKAQIKELEELESDYKKTKQFLNEAREYAESIISTLREPLLVLDADLRVVSASQSFYQVFKVRPEETVNRHVYELGNRQWDIPKLRELLEGILPKRTVFNNFEIEHNFADIGKRTMLLNAREIVRGPGKPKIILLAIEDATDRKKIEKESQDNQGVLEMFRKVTKDQEKLVQELKQEIGRLKNEPK